MEWLDEKLRVSERQAPRPTGVHRGSELLILWMGEGGTQQEALLFRNSKSLLVGAKRGATLGDLQSLPGVAPVPVAIQSTRHTARSTYRQEGSGLQSSCSR